MHRFILFTRAGCHLCTDMARALETLQQTLPFALDIRDVDSDPGLEARWGEWVPTLTTETETEICHYHLDIEAVRRAVRCPVVRTPAPP